MIVVIILVLVVLKVPLLIWLTMKNKEVMRLLKKIWHALFKIEL